MPDAFFDIVVVGTSIPGLAYGALCAKEGYTVLVVGQEAKPSSYSIGEAQVYRTNPLLYGFGTSSVVRSLFKDIGLIAEMRNKPKKIDPYLQVVTPGVRFELSERAQFNSEELAREFPESSDDMERFLRAVLRDSSEMDRFLTELPMLPPKGFWARRKLKKQLGQSHVFDEATEPVQFPGDLKFSSPMSALVLFLSRLHGRPVSPFAVRRMLQHTMGGFFEYPQGIDGLKRLFTDRIIANGGAFWPERHVEQMLLKGKQISEVVIQRPRRNAGVRLLVGNCPFKPFFSLIPQEQQDQQFHAFVKSLQPSSYNYVVNFVVPSDVIPEAMGQNVILVMYPKKEASGPGVLWIYREGRNEEEPESPETLVVTARIDAADLPLEAADFERLNKKILHSLEWVVPFAGERLVSVHSPYATLDRETEQPRLDPAEVQEVYNAPLEGGLDFTGLPCRTGYKNLLLLGDHYLGALGLEGAVVGAQQAFAWTRDNVVLKKILRK